MTLHWGIVEIALTVVLGFGAFTDGLYRAARSGLKGVLKAFIQHAGATLFGLAGGAVSMLALWLFLYAIFAITFGWKWERFLTDPGLSSAVRIGAPVAFFFGAWFATNVIRKRLVVAF